MGETSVVEEQVNFEQVARDVCREIGFDSDVTGLNFNTCEVI